MHLGWCDLAAGVRSNVENVAIVADTTPDDV